MGDCRQGFLVKEGGSWKSWKKRYFVMKNGSLYYSKKMNSGHLGVIELERAGAIQSSDYKKKKFCFSVETPKRTYYLCAKDEQDKQAWIAELTDERDRLQGKGKYAKPPPSPTPSTAVSSPRSASAQSPTPGATPSGQKKVGLEDFDLLRVIGKGSFGKVFQVRKKDTGRIYAMKVLNKKNIIDRQEIEHTKTEKNILQKLVHPFLVNLYFSFQTADKLYFVMDFVNGGELFSHLQKDKRFPEPRVRFYCAEIALGLEYLHNSGVLYRDLKPENLLLTDDGHICMTDFGISKEGLLAEDDRTATFCGTPEYLAPEVLQGSAYGKAVDWWSFGTLMYEMLTGLPPFYSTDVQQMYTKILTAPLVIPDYVSPEARSLLMGLLERNPNKRLQDPKIIKAHPFFKGIDWDKLLEKEIEPPYVPPVKSKEEVTMILDEFKNQKVEMTFVDAKLTESQQQNFAGFTYVAASDMSH